jgi:hypothetical protein
MAEKAETLNDLQDSSSGQVLVMINGIATFVDYDTQGLISSDTLFDDTFFNFEDKL